MCLEFMPNMGIYGNAGCTKTASNLKMLYRKNRFLSKDLMSLLCKALIQQHLDYECAA